MFILIIEAGFPEIDKQLGDGILGYSRHADSRPDTITFNQASHYLDALRVFQLVHTDHYA